MSLLTSVNPWDGGSRWLNQDWCCCWWMFSSDSANLQFWITHNKILETLITLNCLHNHIRTNGPITLGSGTLNTALKMPWKHICTKIKLVLTSRFSFWKIEIILTFLRAKKPSENVTQQHPTGRLFCKKTKFLPLDWLLCMTSTISDLCLANLSAVLLFFSLVGRTHAQCLSTHANSLNTNYVMYYVHLVGASPWSYNRPFQHLKLSEHLKQHELSP